MGAYAKGTDKELDDAIARMPKIEQFLRQNALERIPIAFEETTASLAFASWSSFRTRGAIHFW